MVSCQLHLIDFDRPWSADCGRWRDGNVVPEEHKLQKTKILSSANLEPCLTYVLLLLWHTHLSRVDHCVQWTVPFGVKQSWNPIWSSWMKKDSRYTSELTSFLQTMTTSEIAAHDCFLHPYFFASSWPSFPWHCQRWQDSSKKQDDHNENLLLQSQYSHSGLWMSHVPRHSLLAPKLMRIEMEGTKSRKGETWFWDAQPRPLSGQSGLRIVSDKSVLDADSL